MSVLKFSWKRREGPHSFFFFFLASKPQETCGFFKVRQEALIKFKFRQGITVAENCSGCVAD